MALSLVRKHAAKHHLPTQLFASSYWRYVGDFTLASEYLANITRCIAEDNRKQ